MYSTDLKVITNKCRETVCYIVSEINQAKD